MRTQDIDNFKLSDAVEFHDQLNPKIFAGQRMKPGIRAQLLAIVRDFLEYLGISDLDIEDVMLVGSSAGFTYTDHSDLDLHIIIDYSKLKPDDVYQELFNAKKTLYNLRREISIHRIPVELYVEDKTETDVRHRQGEYSVLNDKWYRQPVKRRYTLDHAAARAKYEKLLRVIQHALKSRDSKDIDRVLKLISKYRKSGLQRHGEYSPENLSYKLVRNQRLIEKLHLHRDRVRASELSLESQFTEAARSPRLGISLDNRRSSWQPPKDSQGRVFKRLNPRVLTGSYTDQQLKTQYQAVQDRDGNWWLPAEQLKRLR